MAMLIPTLAIILKENRACVASINVGSFSRIPRLLVRDYRSFRIAGLFNERTLLTLQLLLPFMHNVNYSKNNKKIILNYAFEKCAAACIDCLIYHHYSSVINVR